MPLWLATSVLDYRDAQDHRALEAELGSPGTASPREICAALVRRNAGQPEIVRLFAVLEAESLAPDHPARNLSDGSYEKYWDSGATLPVSVTLDLGRRRDARFLAVNQREWSPTYARETFGRPEDSARIKDYLVF